MPPRAPVTFKQQKENAVQLAYYTAVLVEVSCGIYVDVRVSL